jgi:hypothetical protein
VSQSGALTASEAKRAELSFVLEFGQAVAEGCVRYLFAEGGDATRPRPLKLV